MPKIIAIINQKGGVGKTTTSINLSAGLALKSYKVLLIDLDPQSHSTSGLGIESGQCQLAIHDVFEHGRNVNDAVIKTKVNNLYLVPSKIRLDKTEQLMSTANFKESILHKAIKNLDYDYIIIDCRPTLGTLTVNALYASNFIIIPCEMSRYSLDGFSDLMDTIDAIKNNDSNSKERFLRILITKLEVKNTVTNAWVFQQLEPFAHLMFETKIRKNEALNQASIVGEPIFTAKPDSHGADDYRQLINEFLTKWTS